MCLRSQSTVKNLRPWSTIRPRSGLTGLSVVVPAGTVLDCLSSWSTVRVP
jgi:hypothetical protein